jgi:ankyrin repeat protein
MDSYVAPPVLNFDFIYSKRGKHLLARNVVYNDGPDFCCEQINDNEDYSFTNPCQDIRTLSSRENFMQIQSQKMMESVNEDKTNINDAAHYFLQQCDLNSLKTLVENYDFDILNELPNALQFAIYYNFQSTGFEIVKYLLDIGFDPNIDNGWCLKYTFSSIHNNGTCLIDLLIKHGASLIIDNFSVSQYIVDGIINDVDCIQYLDQLFDAGLSVNYENYCLIKYACGRGKVNVVQYLINHGSDINIDDGYCLHVACHCGLSSVVKILLENDAIITDSIINCALVSDISCIKLLLEFGAKINTIDCSLTEKQKEMYDLLSSQGIDGELITAVITNNYRLANNYMLERNMPYISY